MNGVPIATMQELREAVHELKGAKPAVFQIERNDQFLYIERELEAQPPEQ